MLCYLPLFPLLHCGQNDGQTPVKTLPSHMDCMELWVYILHQDTDAIGYCSHFIDLYLDIGLGLY